MQKKWVISVLIKMYMLSSYALFYDKPSSERQISKMVGIVVNIKVLTIVRYKMFNIVK